MKSDQMNRPILTQPFGYTTMAKMGLSKQLKTNVLMVLTQNRLYMKSLDSRFINVSSDEFYLIKS